MLRSILFFHGPRTRTQGMFKKPKTIIFQKISKISILAHKKKKKKKSQVHKLCVLGRGLIWASIHNLGLKFSATNSLTRS